MNRYIKLVRQFWSTSMAAELEYRLNFLFATLSSIGGLAGSLFGVYLFYQGGYRFLEGFSSTFLSPNLNRIVKHVENGTLDFVLLKPVNSQFWLSTHTLSPWGLPNMGFGGAIVLYAGHNLNIPWYNYLLGLIPLSFGMVILYSLWFMLGATSIWFTKIYNVTEVLRGLTAAGRFPMAAYPASYRMFDNSARRSDHGAAQLAVGRVVGGDGGDFVWVCQLGLAVCIAILYQCFKLKGEKVAIGPSNLLSCQVGARAMRIGPHD
jgi:ABC-2 type transport system permease protein